MHDASEPATHSPADRATAVDARPGPVTTDALSAVGRALDAIGLNRAHKLILLMVLLGAFFDVMEENSLGAVGPALKDVWHISTTELAFLQTVTITAMIIGKVITGVIGDYRGRRFALAFNLFLYCLGALVCALSPNYEVLAVGRFLVGIGLGGEIAAGMTLLSELVPTRFRGAVVASLNVGAGGLGNMLSFGFAALVLGPLGTFFGGPDNSWRWMFGLLVLPAVLVVVYRRYLPETPRYLASRGRIDEANQVLTRLASGRLKDTGARTVDYLPPSVAESAKPEKVRLAEVFQGRLLRRTAALAVASWMSFGAQTTVLVLMPTILVDQGYSITESLTFTMVMNVGSLLGAAAATYAAAHWPRRLVTTSGALAACLAALAFGFLAQGTALILLLGGLFQFFVLMLNSTIFAWAPELYPTRVRAFGTSMIAVQGNVAGALAPLGAGLLLDSSGAVAVFLVIAVMYAVMAVATRFAPETHGRPLEDINSDSAQAT
ncbi:MFS transporter [Streptomyces sp. NPDC047070]|uniref:MFS transporter n=1 Tax=Streptomyces sp. NPDC047070 TaxID=3154923 RepID=UPI00345502EB